MIPRHADLSWQAPLSQDALASDDMSLLAGYGVWRSVAACLSVALVIAAVGLWAIPAENSAVSLLKLGASITFLGGACLCLLAARPKRAVRRLELDLAGDEIRVVAQDAVGRLFLQERHSLAHIGDVQFEKDRFCAWDLKGDLLLDVPVRERGMTLAPARVSRPGPHKGG